MPIVPNDTNKLPQAGSMVYIPSQDPQDGKAVDDSFTVTEDASSVDSPQTMPVPDEDCQVPVDGVKPNLFAGVPTSPYLRGGALGNENAIDHAWSKSFSDVASMFSLKKFIPFCSIKNLIAASFGLMNVFAYLIIKGQDAVYESLVDSKVHGVFVISSLLLLATSKSSNASTNGERLLLFMACTVIVSVSVVAMLIVTSPCMHCASLFTASAVDSSKFNVPDQTDYEWIAWHLLLGEDVKVKEDVQTVACRKCVSSLVVFSSGGLQAYLKKQLGMAAPPTVSREVKELPVKEEYLQDDVSDLASWYLQWANETISRDKEVFFAKVAASLEANGRLAGEDLTDAMHGYLCSPATRFDNPDPVKFLSNLKTAKFTGEKGLANLTTTSLQRIMRGDILKELGPAVCFMLRFALAVPENHHLETTPIKHTTILPSLNEDSMKSYDIRFELPGVMMPQLDQDIDPKGDEIKRFRKIMEVFTQLPFEDKILYFDTQEEYLAFFRWELEKSIQDAFYFPRWLVSGPKGELMADIMAKKIKHSNDRLILQDANSDKTMSDRIFFGTGQRLLTPIRLPGIDEDHAFTYPHRAKHFLTDEHRAKFRYTNKPSQKELLNMVKQMYPNKVKDSSTMLEWRDKILQLDFAALETLAPRESFYPFGAILYVDVKSKMPMGVWISGRKRLFLPNEGRDWEHAKFFWRINERGALTGLHVAEDHFGWSHSVATAAWQTLPPDHGLRALVKPFTMAVHSINSAAYNMLIREHSVLTHGSELQTQPLAESFHVVYTHLNYSETIPDMLDSHDLEGVVDTSKLPMFSQGRRLYDAHRKFVGKYVSLVYASDEEMLKDDSTLRFWHHVNTQGRHTDPCVCGMDTELFFDDRGKWPAFETKHTCEDLLDASTYHPELNMISRRRQWCDEVQPFDRIKALYSVLTKECSEKKDCKMQYGVYMMKDNMGLKPLKTREQLADFVASFMWHVSAGHEINGDNIPYFTDPFHSGVRLRGEDENGELPLRVDIGTYVFGLAIGALTTVRSYPLLGDWSPLYSHFASSQKDLSVKERQELAEALDAMHVEYKLELVDLANTFLDETIARPNNQRWNALNPANQAAAVAV